MSNTATRVVRYITLDVQETICAVTVSLTQGDSSRRLAITPTAGGVAVELPPGCSALFVARAEDGRAISDPCTVDHRRGCILYDVSETVADRPGYIEGQFEVVSRDSTVLMTPRMAIAVKANLFDPVVTESGSFDALRDLVAQFSGEAVELRREHEELRSEYRVTIEGAETVRMAAEAAAASAEAVADACVEADALFASTQERALEAERSAARAEEAAEVFNRSYVTLIES